jgi:signal transduction histidine kinase/ActR/RegA family two-component response regulator
VVIQTPLEELAAEVAVLRRTMWVGLLGGVLLAVVAGWLLARRLAEPIGQLARATGRVAAGDLEARSGLPGGRGELSQLGHAFDEMAEALQTQRAEAVQAEKERERLLGHIQQQAQRMQEIMDTVPEGVLLLDSSGRIVMANRVATGDLATLADAEVGDALTHLGGRPIAELLTSPPIKGMWHEVAAGGWVFEVIARPVEHGPEPTGWVMVMRDVTRERDIQRHAQRQERLAAVGQLAAGIAHDFNNIMGVIVLYSQLSRGTPNLPPEVRERLETIDRQAKHATDLITQILDFSRRSVLKRRPLDLAALVKEQVKLLQRALPENIQVTLTYGREECSVKADLTRVQQIIMNLAFNARDAMLPTGDGELRIALSRMAEADEIECSTCGQVVAGRNGWVMLQVADTGTGIPEETLPHIFEPFFTTKERGKGTGLGLAQVSGIVSQHEGHIVVATRPGEGTTFTVYLPALSLREAPAPQDRAPQERPEEGHGETILVVEDNRDMRNALVASLARLGYRTREAPDGREALALFAEQADDPSAPGIALVLSDLVMPRMGGQALFHALKQRDPAIKVVLLTGHPMEEELGELEEQGLSGWLFKPPNLEKLAQLLQQVLRDG